MAEKINLVVIRSELDFKTSLVPGDEFYVKVVPKRLSKLKFAFKQKIIRKSDEKVAVEALVIGTSVNERGRPFLPAEIDALFSTHNN